MVRTQIQLTEDQAERVKRIARSRHLSSAELIRQAVDAMIRPGASADMEERRKRAVEIAGRFASGRRDISEKHDRYLEEAYNS